MAIKKKRTTNALSNARLTKQVHLLTRWVWVLKRELGLRGKSLARLQGARPVDPGGPPRYP